ncbi:glycoside hydrolase/deacetylase [Mytilinidion resinicola]|uniref:Glycoside hydrolase/deacetylase n=1 Tax=Mytilinidion resinicola TaxID=574789 RepID=A0A6A6Z3Z7_9PEZI|nr:glycoside hydrolase/deacetylase [Mytilinidion resinicola]KAF2814977.1 glycoside hydrolase/deacetylase [Mytilinidion resinicola]
MPVLLSAHGTGQPRLYGKANVADLKARAIFGSAHAAAHDNDVEGVKDKRNIKRDNTDDQCGKGFPHCAAGYCCSEAGWCGQGIDYCYSPGCQYQYGPACPENITPAGISTSTIPRPALGKVPYGGVGIYECTTPGTVALTFDDGPYIYTSKVLDVLASYGAKATFFITGNNNGKGEIDIPANGYVPVIQRMHAENHQIASHTWTHLDLSAISAVDRKNQMYKNEMALRNILGFIPTYMRPPYSSCTPESRCEADMKALGYHIIYFDVDTDDYEQDSPDKIQNSKDWFKGNITASDATAADSEWLVISHDIHYQTAYNLTDYMISTLTSLGYKAVTVGECLGDPVANWYRSADVASSAVSKTSTGSAVESSTVSSTSFTTKTTTSSSLVTASSSSSKPTTSLTTTSSPPTPSTIDPVKVSIDGTCGGTNGFTCEESTYGNCCSPSGWCGSSPDYCSTGCQPAFGLCGTVSAAPAASSTAVSTEGSCGGVTGRTCEGSAFGNCCSAHGWCGSTADYCLASSGCQDDFGTCG